MGRGSADRILYGDFAAKGKRSSAAPLSCAECGGKQLFRGPTGAFKICPSCRGSGTTEAAEGELILIHLGARGKKYHVPDPDHATWSLCGRGSYPIHDVTIHFESETEAEEICGRCLTSAAKRGILAESAV